MKKVFTLILGIGLFSGASAQGSFELSYAQQVPTAINTDLVNEVAVDYVFVKNISTSDKLTRAERTVNTVVSNGTYTQETYFCWDNCYSSATSISINSGMNIAAGATFTAFSVHFLPNTVAGCTDVTMRFFDKNNTADFVEQSFKFCATEGGVSILDQIKNGNVMETPFPNPASDVLNVKFNLPRAVKDAQVLLVDMTGRTIKSHKPSGNYGLMVWDVQDLPEGLYYMMMTGEGEVLGTQKIVVKH